MSEDIKVTDGTVLETLNGKVDLDGGNYVGSPLEEYIHNHCAGLEIGDIGIAPLGIDETQGKRRYLNGQLIIQDQYVEFTNKVKSAVALYPSLACTEAEWQTTATMTVGGQVGKFVVDDEGGTIRLPKIIMPIQGLTDLSKLAEIVEAGLPNITGTFGGIEATGFNPTGAFADAGTGKITGAAVSGNAGDPTVSFDASRSNAIYGNSNTVQQEQIQYPYFIQVATGSETEDNIINEIELNNPFSLLDYKYSEYELNNLSWLRSNGQYNSKAVYPAVYDLLLKIYNGTETKAGVSVKLSTETFTDYDFVLNTAEETFRLPVITTNRVLVAKKETTDGDATWFNLYSDGWLEQGGIVYATSKYIDIIFPKPYKNDEYTRNVSGLQTDGEYTDWYAGTSYETPTGMRIAGQSNMNTFYASWFTCGYAEIPTENNNLYFYVGETVQNANLINAGRIEEKIADLITVVETYQNGTSWYRIWSDKFCQQGGSKNGSISLKGDNAITFLKEFKDKNYTFTFSMANDDVSTTMGDGAYEGYNLRTTSSVTIHCSTALTGFAWEASGYIA